VAPGRGDDRAGDPSRRAGTRGRAGGRRRRRDPGAAGASLRDEDLNDLDLSRHGNLVATGSCDRRTPKRTHGCCSGSRRARSCRRPVRETSTLAGRAWAACWLTGRDEPPEELTTILPEPTARTWVSISDVVLAGAPRRRHRDRRPPAAPGQPRPRLLPPRARRPRGLRRRPAGQGEAGRPAAPCRTGRQALNVLLDATRLQFLEASSVRVLHPFRRVAGRGTGRPAGDEAEGDQRPRGAARA
jgi:hypothetical protein